MTFNCDRPIVTFFFRFRDNRNLSVPTFQNGVWWTYPAFICAEMVPTMVSEGFPELRFWWCMLVVGRKAARTR